MRRPYALQAGLFWDSKQTELPCEKNSKSGFSLGASRIQARADLRTGENPPLPYSHLLLIGRFRISQRTGHDGVQLLTELLKFLRRFGYLWNWLGAFFLLFVYDSRR